MKHNLNIILRLPLKIWLFTEFLVFYLKELVLANIKLARDILGEIDKLQPAIVAIELDITKDIEILTLVNLVTMTPGSLSLDISDDKKILFVHALYVDNVDEFRKLIKNSLERRVINMYT